ncbi:MAG TPA: chemotaxis protein CheW [Xanthobacteraceae bacterium]|nr:chemotaxis protein CheW [Xanthobacteraceae bacterium]
MRTETSPVPSEANSQIAAARAAGGAPDRTEFISFAIGDDQYGVDIMSVREIKGWSEITPLPNQPEYVRGVLNLRGAMVPIIDLRCRFGQGLTEATPLHIMIIVQVDGRPVGLLADRVLDIVAADGGEIQSVPDIAQTAGAQFLSGLVTIDGAMIALINLPTLVALPS